MEEQFSEWVLAWNSHINNKTIAKYNFGAIDSCYNRANKQKNNECAMKCDGEQMCQAMAARRQLGQARAKGSMWLSSPSQFDENACENVLTFVPMPPNRLCAFKLKTL